MGQSATGVVGGWIGGDVAIPDPSDAAWPKWIGYGVVMGGAILYDACTDGDGDECEKLYKQIDTLVGILKKRYADMLIDKHDLYNTVPTGKNSWAGHQQQFKQVQRTLRTVLRTADKKFCKGYRSDAWRWATMQPPSKPSLK